MERVERLKEEMVEQLVTRRGGFYEAVMEVRTRWGLSHIPAQLPPESKDTLLPPGLEGPGSSEEQRELWLKAKRRWTGDLHYVLVHGGAEKYVSGKGRLYLAGGDDPESWLPWYRFAGACVLYDPPQTEDLEAFAECGGLPLLAGSSTKEEPILGVLDSRELLMERLRDELDVAVKEEAFRLMWEHRAELSELDFDDAWREVFQRYGEEIWKRRDQIQEKNNLEIERHERAYYVEVDDATVDEQAKRARAVATRQKMVRPPVGRARRNRLQAITIAILMDECRWKQREIAEHYNWQDETLVSKYAKDGRDIQSGG